MTEEKNNPEDVNVPNEEQEEVNPEIEDTAETAEEIDIEIEDLVPKMEVKCAPDDTQECIVGDEVLVGLYEEILENARNDREQSDDLLANFVNMVLNDGESSSASKEAIVNLMKVKSDISDKMTKIADLMTRIKLKERDTFPRYLASQQNNKIVFDGSGKRDFLKQLEEKAKNNGK